MFEIKGDPGNVHSDFSVQIDGDVNGNVNAGESVTCADVDGDVFAGTGVKCSDVGGHLSAGSGVVCADVEGNVKAGGSVSCGDVAGSVTGGGNVTCGDVAGNVTAGGAASCESASGCVRSGRAVSRQQEEDAFERELNERIDREIENSVRFSDSMKNYGDELGRKISEFVQRQWDVDRKDRKE